MATNFVYMWGVHWRHLANTTEPSVCGGNAALCHTPFHNNCLVAIVHTKLVIAILVPKLAAMATTLRRLTSAMSLSDSLTRETHPYNQTVCRKLSYNQNYSPSKAKNWLPGQSPLGPVEPHLTHDSSVPVTALILMIWWQKGYPAHKHAFSQILEVLFQNKWRRRTKGRTR